ncbi:MarP family serine protease [Iamia majanohamensis]|uniref:MarP family serine protease n=1 Tax=Iamia majanohamensis TaxID=467976 RepID=A0AAF0BVU2_9ACTN|nr:MarP family serine protease [Iamia majanohamensis]WCO69202.1 MarP family serine protease [Iamia majanohamensis]
MLDLLLLVALVVAAVAGYRLGFVARAASWAGMLLGVVLAARLMPRAIEAVGEDGSRATVLLVAAGLLLGGALAGQALGVVVGSRAQTSITSPRARRVDAAGGAAAGVVGLLVLVWLVVPALADVSGWQAREVRRSRIVSTLSEQLPPAPDATKTLRQLLGDGYPQVFDGLDRSPDVGPPPGETGLSEDRAAGVAASIVKVSGEACDRIQEGTGFVVAEDLVVTNAHVVAGEPETVLVRPDGSEVDAALVAFDADRDLAVLRAPGLGLPALPITGSDVGQSGAVFGHPGGRPLELSPFDVRQRIDAVGTDIYGEPGTTRDVLVLAADLEPGDSGSPLVDAAGQVVGVAFAIAPDRSGVAYAVSTDELQAVLATAGSRVPAGPCAA